METTNTEAANQEHPLDRAARLVGGRESLAKLRNVSVGAIGNWKLRGIPFEQCVSIEQLTGGAVTCEELRPDKAADFAYLRATPQPTTEPAAAGV